MHKIKLGFIIIPPVFLAIFIFSGGLFHLLLASDAGLFTSAISRLIVKHLPKNHSPALLITAVRDYLYLTVHPLGKPLFNEPNNLLAGQGFCNHVVGVFLRLLEPNNIKACILFLKVPGSEKSPHTVALVDACISSFNSIGCPKEECVVDPTFRISYRLANGKCTPLRDICHSGTAPQGVDIRSKWFCRYPKLVNCNRPIDKKNLFQKYFTYPVGSIIPVRYYYRLLQFALRFNLAIDSTRRLYLMARVDELFLHFNGARKIYLRIEKMYPDSIYAPVAQHYRTYLNDVERCFANGKYTAVLPARADPYQLPAAGLDEPVL